MVLLDLSVSGEPGLDPLRRLHGHTAAAHIPIVAMTEDEQEELAMQALKAGAQEYLVRGEFQARVLVRTIQRAIVWRGRSTPMRLNCVSGTATAY